MLTRTRCGHSDFCLLTPAFTSRRSIKRAAPGYLELRHWLCLPGANAAGGNVCQEVVLAVERAASQTAQHGDLADVRQRIGNRALEQLFSRARRRHIGSQTPVEGPERGEKARRSLLPRDGARWPPLPRSVRKLQRPVQQIPQCARISPGVRTAPGKVANSADAPSIARFPRYARVARACRSISVFPSGSSDIRFPPISL